MSNEYIQLDEISGSIKSPGPEELAYNEKTNLLPLPSSIAVSAEDSQGAHSNRLKENRWSSMYALFVHLSQVLGHTNQIHFPHLAGQHGGAAFMIPYFLAYICVGIPILYAEMILGQFSSMPAQYIFRHLSPALAGISIAMFAVNIYRSLYYSALISQLLYAGAISFQGFWAVVDGLNGKCSKTSNSLLCRDFGDGHFCNAFPPGEVKCSWDSTAELLSSSPQVFAAPHTDYIATNVLKVGPANDNIAFPPISLAVILLFVWVCIICLTYAGSSKKLTTKMLSKVFMVLKSVSIGVTVLNMIIALATRAEGGNGIQFFLKPDFRAILKPEAWSDAVTHVIFSLCLGDGTIHKISSHNEFSINALYHAIIVSVADISMSFIAGIIYFASVGSISVHLYGMSHPRLRINRVLKHGFPLTITAFPELMISTAGNFWSTALTSAHYFSLAKSGIVNLAMYANLTVSSVMSILTCWTKIDNRNMVRGLVSVIVGVLCFLSSLILIAPAGVYLYNLVIEYSNMALLVICLAEILTLVYGYGFGRFLINIEAMIMKDTELMLSITSIGVWYYVITPIFLIFAIINQFLFNDEAIISGYKFPKSFEMFGWTIFTSCIMMIPTVVLLHLFLAEFNPNVIGAAFEPTNFWGPADREDRKLSEKKARAVNKTFI